MGPFRVWAIDLMVGLPPGRDNHTVCVVAIDVFSKFIVMNSLPNKESLTLAEWLYDRVICEYGVPLVVRSDRGTEFKGHFD